VDLTFDQGDPAKSPASPVSWQISLQRYERDEICCSPVSDIQCTKSIATSESLITLGIRGLSASPFSLARSVRDILPREAE
jgi:hypothetical protein